MFKKLTAAVLATVAVAAPAAAEPLPTWYGTYVWEESLGQMGGYDRGDGPVAFVTRRLTLGPAAGSSGCRIHAQGFQTYETMQCTATPEGASVVIKYYNFRAGAADRYRQGAPLFRMTRSGRGLMTELQAMRPSSDATAPAGRLFRRVG